MFFLLVLFSLQHPHVHDTGSMFEFNFLCFANQGILGIPKIRKNYNPATWMLEVTSISAEAELGLDFAQVYESSILHE